MIKPIDGTFIFQPATGILHASVLIAEYTLDVRD